MVDQYKCPECGSSKVLHIETVIQNADIYHDAKGPFTLLREYQADEVVDGCVECQGCGTMLDSVEIESR